MAPQTDPYAAYGGSIAPQPTNAPTDPYAAYGGSVAAIAPTPAAATGGDENPVTGTLSGIGAGMFRTAQGAENLINKALPKSAQIPPIPSAYTEENTTAQKVGGGLESIGEFLAGDEALKGISLADRLGLSAQVAKIAQQSPRLARAIEIGMNAFRSGIVGGGQGATGAAAQGNSVKEGTEKGFGAAASGSAAGETLIGPAINKAGEMLESFSPKLGNALLQANKVKNFEYGKNPGRVFADESIPVPKKPWGGYADVQKSIEQAGKNIANEARNTILQSPNASAKVDVVPNLDHIFDNALQDLTSKSGLPDRRGLITDLENLRQEVTHNFDTNGNPTNPKGPMTPTEITRLKSSIGRGTKWDPTKAAESQQFLNGVRKQVYSYLDGEVDRLVPEMQSINARWANQISAEQLIKNRVAQEQAAGYGHSRAVSSAVLGAALELIHHGDPIAGGALILNEAARTPAARILGTKAAAAAGEALASPATAAAAAHISAAGASTANRERQQN